MELSQTLDRIMQADRYRLTQQWQRLSGSALDHRGNAADHVKGSTFERWQQSLHQSKRTFLKRDRSVPELAYDPDLPITAHRDEIIQLLHSRQTIVVCGETGSGKSTQLPKICLDAGLGRAGMIGHTQPRRLAARAVASRLAQELNTQIGGLVGFKIRFSDATSADTLVKVMTDGVLLAETQSDRFLDQYDVLIIDEAHERSLNIDFLLGYLRKMQSKRPELKLIITSATIDPQRFSEHFSDQAGPAPIVEVSGRTYPVEIRYRPPFERDAEGSTDMGEEEFLHRSIAQAVDELWQEGSGDILVFFPTERDIRLSSKHLRGHFAGQRIASDIEILPLYARLSQPEQNRIFAGHKGRRLVLATNVAESSLTVPGIHYVIDTGLVRLSRYASRSKVQRLPIEPVSQASANQRSGRCGRLGPGVCIRLYAQADFESRPTFTTPEIRRSDLANVLLHSYTLKLGPLDQFPLLDVPNPEAIRDAQRTLRELGAIDSRHQLTAIGKQLGRLPCDVRVGRMLLEAHQRNCLSEVVIIAAGLESPDVRQRPAGNAPQADAAHGQFRDPHSDFLGLVRLWDFYENLRDQLGRSRLQKALQQNFLSHHSFREWSDVIRQLKELLGTAGLKIGRRRLELSALTEVVDPEQSKLPRPEGYAAIHQSLLAGLLSGIAERDPQKFEYKAVGGLSIRLWPGSGLFRQSPKWIMAAEIVETTHRYGRTVAELDVEWIEHAGRDLLKYTYHDPFWSEKSGAAMVYRRSSLYGLTIVPARRVPLASIDPTQAREMLIEHGLVEGKWRFSLPFYQHNLEMIADMEELVRRTRSRRYVVDRYSMIRFYSRCLPETVVDMDSLRNWVTQHPGSAEEKALWLQADDLIADDGDEIDLAVAFPNTIKIGVTEFPVSYHFEPGSESDGVTISVPQVALRQVSEGALGWLVPGLLEEKILSIIRTLPKSIRTNYLPAPEVAQKLAQQLSDCDRKIPFTKALAERMSRHSGQSLNPSQLVGLDLPQSLRFRIQVIDETGTVIATGRDIGLLQSQCGLDSRETASTLQSDNGQWANRSIKVTQDLDGLPAELPIVRGGITVVAYCAIVDIGKAVEARLVDTQDEAERLSRMGFIRLFALKNERLLRNQVKHLPQWNQAAVALSSIFTPQQLQQSLQDLIIRLALLENCPLPVGSVEFEARQSRAVAQISIAAQEVAVWMPKLADSYQQLRLALEKAPQAWDEVTTAIRNQVSELFGEGFMLQTPWRWLCEYPRYLQAAKMRLEKLSAGGLPKDRKLTQPLNAARAAYVDAVKANTLGQTETAAALDELRWALEEFQVSLFAQQLGTKITVSAKRIDDMLKKLQR